MNFKALKILKKPDLIHDKIDYRTRKPYLNYVYNKNKIDEAIEELEGLGSKMTRSDAKQEVIEMFKTIPFSQLKIGNINNIIDKIYDNFENK